MKNSLNVIYFLSLISISLHVAAAGPDEETVYDSNWMEPVVDYIKTENYLAAIEELKIANKIKQADWHNLMGFALRKKSPADIFRSEQYYKRALEIDPGHKQALEYYGELKLMKKDLKGAEGLLKRLGEACPQGCEEKDELAEAINDFKQQ